MGKYYVMTKYCTQADHIISKFGGLTALSLAFDPPIPVTTIQGWTRSGFIPSKYHSEILDSAKNDSRNVSEKDFFPPFCQED